MRQIFQDLSSGETILESVPRPAVKSGHLLIRTTKSLVSIGTEKMLVEFGKASLFSKARQQPDKVRMVLDKFRTDGISPTVEAIRSKLNQPLPMGYSNVGIIEEIGAGVSGFEVGQRVLSNGNHAEFVCIPKNLCASIPDEVSDDEAAFGVVGAIALQGLRLTMPTLGETVVVIGLGIIGLMTVQLLRANGCRVIGVDFDERKLNLAKNFGATVVNPHAGVSSVDIAMGMTGGIGADAVIITASAKGNKIIHDAATMSRQRGRIVLVGVVGLELSRADFYEKELSFQVSCSYGPGRYDPSYEESGNDYPIAFVRWTEQRNFHTVLQLLAHGDIRVDELITSRHPIENAASVYEKLSKDSNNIGMILEYDSVSGPNAESIGSEVQTVKLRDPIDRAETLGISVIGAGNYASRVLIPAFAKQDIELVSLVSNSGASGALVGKRQGFLSTTTDAQSSIDHARVNAVVIATRHNTHSDYVQRALESGKHVFVEKPLCLTHEELHAIEHLARRSAGILMIGFNRRFAPLIREMKERLSTLSEPLAAMMVVNAGAIPSDHWTQDPAVGGGRIVGEACHFIDLLRFLVGHEIVSMNAKAMRSPEHKKNGADSATISLGFADGSTGVISYLANGHSSIPKEKLQVFCAGKVMELDNFRRLKAWGWGGFSGRRSFSQDKGQNDCVSEFVDSIRRGDSGPIPLEEIIEVSRFAIEAQEAVN